jgi:hypothetical protein
MCGHCRYPFCGNRISHAVRQGFVEQFLFSFEDEAHARIFVERVAHYLDDLAIFRDESDVIVIDGSDYGQREEIFRLAKGSNALRHRGILP